MLIVDRILREAIMERRELMSRAFLEAHASADLETLRALSRQAQQINAELEEIEALLRCLDGAPSLEVHPANDGH